MVSLLFFGSRSLSGPASPDLPRAVSSWLAAGGRILVGSASGADALVVRAAVRAGGAGSLSVFAAFSRSGLGVGPWSSLPSARAAAAAGASVFWLAGGPLSVPLRGRLAGRSAAAASLAGGGVCFSAGGRLGPGSSLALSLLASRGRPVWCFAPSAPAPVPCVAGSWVADLFCGLSCFRFSPAQRSFF